jgi:hypothetical protein
MKNIYEASILFLVLALFPVSAAACRCSIPEDVSTSFREATVVVAAEAMTVTRARNPAIQDRPSFEADIETVVWSVHESWKGAYPAGQQLTTVTDVTCCLCGGSANKGDLVLLYLHGNEPFQLSTCSRTSPLKNALKDIPMLYKLAAETP